MGQMDFDIETLLEQGDIEAALPWMSPAQCAVLERAARNSPIEGGQNGSGTALRGWLVRFFDPQPDLGEVATVSVGVGDLRCDVSLSGGLTRYLCEDLLADEDLAGLPVSLRTAVFACALDKALDWVQAPLGLQLEVQACRLGELRRARGDPVFRVEADGATLGFVRLHVDAGNEALVSGLLGAHGAGRAKARLFGAVTVPLAAALPPMALSLGEFRSLAVGDVLCCGVARGNVAHDLLVAGEPVARLRRSMEGRYTIMEVCMSDTTEHPFDDEDGEAGEDSPVIRDKVMLSLRFELGQRRISIEMLQRLVAGQVLEIPDASLNRVRIRANGAVVGVGELVRVGDGLGVQVMELSDEREQRPA